MEVINGGKTNRKSNKKKASNCAEVTITLDEEKSECNVSLRGSSDQIAQMTLNLIGLLFQDKNFLGKDADDAKALFVARLIAIEGITFDDIISNYSLIVSSIFDNVDDDL
jgi:hypothetical protein